MNNVNVMYWDEGISFQPLILLPHKVKLMLSMLIPITLRGPRVNSVALMRLQGGNGLPEADVNSYRRYPLSPFHIHTFVHTHFPAPSCCQRLIHPSTPISPIQAAASGYL
jgi:hypothetical protein